MCRGTSLIVVALFLLLSAGTIRAAGKVIRILDLSDPLPSVFPTHTEKPHYVVAVSSDENAAAEGRRLFTEAKGIGEAKQSRTMLVTDANGTQYVCKLPPVRDDMGEKEHRTCSDGKPSGADDGEQGRCAAEGDGVEDDAPQQLRDLSIVDTPEELLDAEQGWCAHKLDGWWGYEFCYKKHVLQYHSEGTKITEQYVLGNYSASDTDTNAVKVEKGATGGEMRYVEQVYNNGTICGVTNGARAVNVRFICGQSYNPRIVEIQETTSCRYVLTVETSKLCMHPSFVEPSTPPTIIDCYRIEDGDDYFEITNSL